MPQQVFYVHGGESFARREDFLARLSTKGIWDLPQVAAAGKWTDTLRTDLGPGFEVFMPQMPNKQNARYDEWTLWFSRHFTYLRDGVVLVGCSLGGMFLLKYLLTEPFPYKIKALYLMATPVGLPNFDSGDCFDFVTPIAEVGRLRSVVSGQIYIWHSTDDFVVPIEHSEALHRALPGSTFTRFTDKNHFILPTLPELVTDLQKLA